MPEPVALSILRADHPAHTPEAEMILVQVREGRVLLALDDGTALDLDARELASAIGATGALDAVRRAA